VNGKERKMRIKETEVIKREKQRDGRKGRVKGGHSNSSARSSRSCMVVTGGGFRNDPFRVTCGSPPSAEGWGWKEGGGGKGEGGGGVNEGFRKELSRMPLLSFCSFPCVRPCMLPYLLPACLSVCLSVCLPVYLAICLSVRLPVCMPIYLFFYLSVRLPVYLSGWLFVRLYLRKGSLGIVAHPACGKGCHQLFRLERSDPVGRRRRTVRW
jgi:hypothetical protein